MELTLSDGCSREWSRCGNPRLGQTIAYASSHAHRSHSCTRLFESNKAPRFCFPETQNQVHLFLALHRFLSTSATIPHSSITLGLDAVLYHTLVLELMF